MTEEIRLLERVLSDNLSWERRRINFLAAFLIALFQVKTVNLQQIAVAFAGRALVASHYRRIRRFLAEFSISEAELARLVVRVMRIEPPFVLTFDRTEWKVGSRWVNVLMLAIVWKGVAIPVLWKVLSKRGCSNCAERNELLERFLLIFQADDIRFLCADREFADQNWLPSLRKRQIHYRLRIKQNAQITDNCGKRMRAARLIQTSRFDQAVNCRRKRRLWGETVWIAGMRRKNGDHVLVISSEPSQSILSDYALRWQIETLFGCLKTRGFRLEDTRLQETERISRLLCLLALGFCWALRAGKVLCEKRPLKVKKHGRAEKSIFRVGFDALRRLFYKVVEEERQKQESRQLISLLSGT